jgi:hypothetical protein
MSTEVKQPEVKQPETAPKAEPKVEKAKDEPTPKPPFSPDPRASLSDNVRGYMGSREFPDYVRLNDFLKSLFKLPRVNEVPEWQNKRISKDIRAALETLQGEGVLQIRNDTHKKLGGFFYDSNDSQQRTMHYHIGDVDIFAKK